MAHVLRRLMLSAMAVALVAPAAVPRGAAAASTFDVPGQFATIQAAINAAAPGDIVLVAPGTYFESINFSGKAITVTSSGGPASTIIDAGGAGRVATFSGGEGRSSVLRGFTLQNGRAGSPESGGGIEISGSSPTIDGNVITNNSACLDGGGIDVNFGSPLIQGNTITNNASASGGCSGGIEGGGINVGGAGSAQIIGNTISGNTSFWGGAIGLFAAGTPTIADNVLSGNTASSDGGAIWSVNQSDAILVQNLVTGNRSGGNGGGFNFLPPSGTPGPTMVNNTLVGDTATGEGSELYFDGFVSTTRVSNNIAVGGAGQGGAVFCDQTFSTTPPILDHNDAFTPNGGVGFASNCGSAAGSSGNVSLDPRFAGAADVHLQAGSPVIDAGNSSAPDLPATDLDGGPRIVGPAVDMGVFEAPPAAPAAASFSPASVSFGTLQGSPTVIFAPVTLTNTGGAALQVTSDTVQGPGNAFGIGKDGCAGTRVFSGASCVIQVGFLPTTSGSFTGTLQVTDNLGTQSVPLSGTVQTGHAAASPTALGFATMAVGRRSKTQTVTVTNTGNTALHIASLALAGANPGDFVIVVGKRTNCANATLAVGAQCTVQLAFQPTATGARSASLDVNSDDPTSPAVVTLTGAGV